MSDWFYTSPAGEPDPAFREAFGILTGRTPIPDRPVTCPKFKAMLEEHHRACLEDEE